MNGDMLSYCKDHISEHVVAVFPVGIWRDCMVFDFEFDVDRPLLGPPQYVLLDKDGMMRVTVEDEGMQIFDELLT